MAHRINPEKLLLSKWTAVSPLNREKHFIVTRVMRNDAGHVTTCTIEAVHSRREQELAWQELRDDARWRPGWR